MRKPTSVKEYLQRSQEWLDWTYQGRGKGTKEGRVEDLDRSLTIYADHNLTRNTSSCLALGYLHGTTMHDHGDLLVVESDIGREGQVGEFIRYLEGNSEWEGFMRETVKNLPRISGLKKRELEQFRMQTSTVSSREDNPKVNTYGTREPIISVLTIGVTEDYPHNKRGKSIRAFRDLADIGSRIMQEGKKYDTFPFWANASFGFGKGDNFVGTQNARMMNAEFLKKLYGYSHS